MSRDKIYYQSSDYVPFHTTVDLGNSDIGTVGDVLSSRMVFNIEDETGKITKGFFTETTDHDYMPELRRRFENVASPELMKKFRSVQNTILDVANAVSLREAYVNGLGLITYNRRPEWKKGKSVIQDADSMSKFLDFLDSVGVRRDTLPKNYARDPEFWEYASRIVENINDVCSLAATHSKIHSQTIGSNINRRNNAMSDYARLLGVGNIVARSVPMTIKNKGRNIDGSFMVNADGFGYSDLMKEAKVRAFGSDSRQLALSGSAVKSINTLQILDFLCANVDRHQGNMFYQIDTVNGQPTIVGVQGIDNDASFGAVDYQGDGPIYYMSKIDDIKLIDSALAENILGLSEDDMEKTILPTGLSVTEVSAAKERLEALKEKIRSGNIERVADDAAWNAKAQPDEIKNLTSVKPAGQRQHMNIFGNVSAVCNNYGYYVSRRRMNDVMEPDFNLDIEDEKTPTGKIVNINEKLAVSEYADRIAQLGKKIKNDNIVSGVFIQKISDTTDALRDVTEKSGESLSDNQRNFIAEKLAELEAAAEKYAHHDNISQKNSHFAKSIAAFVGIARQGVQRDAVEAEKNMASRMAVKLAAGEEANVNGAGIDEPEGSVMRYEFIEGMLRDSDSALISSSDQFKEMTAAFGAVRDIEDNNTYNSVRKQVLFNKLADKAQVYIDYKMSQGKLSKYAQKRVEVAKLMRDYGRQMAKEANPAYKATEDVKKLMQFEKRCTLLSDRLSAKLNGNGNNAEVTGKQELAVINERDNFIKGIKEVIEIAGKYPKDNEVYKLCLRTVTSRGVSQFESQYTDLSTMISGEQKNDFCESMGLDSAVRLRIKQLTEEGEALKTAEAQAAAQRAARNAAAQNAAPEEAASQNSAQNSSEAGNFTDVSGMTVIS